MMCKTMQSTTWHRKLHTEREGLNQHATIPLPVLQLLLLSAPRAPLWCCLQAATLNVHRHGLPKFILWRKVILMQCWQSTAVQWLAQSKIWQLHVSILIQQQVVWLDVSGPFHHSQFSPSSKESRRRYKRKNCLGFSFYPRSFWLNDSGKNTKSRGQTYGCSCACGLTELPIQTVQHRSVLHPQKGYLCAWAESSCHPQADTPWSSTDIQSPGSCKRAWQYSDCPPLQVDSFLPSHVQPAPYHFNHPI